MRNKVEFISILCINFINPDIYKAIYGLTLLQTVIAWKHMMMAFIHPKSYTKKHFLWTLHFLNHYQTKACLAHDLNAAPGTIVKWVLYTINCLANLKIVSSTE